MNRSFLLLGGRSDIGLAIARHFASEGFDILLAGRETDSMEAIKSDIAIRHGVNCETYEFDAEKTETHPAFYNSLTTKPDVIVYAIGYLGEQPVAEKDWEEASRIINTNYVGAVSILSIAANDLEYRREGSIIGISSVAGERGRQSNYIYGSAKSGFSTFLDGLRHRLGKNGITVLNVKPGFVATKMTSKMDLLKPLTADPTRLANAVFRAYKRKKATIYYLPVWRVIMFVIRNIPEKLFIKSKL